MKHLARTEVTPQAKAFHPAPRLVSRFEMLLKGGLLLVALALLAGFMPCGAATTPAPAPEEDSVFDSAPAASPDRRDGGTDEAPLLVFALVGSALLAVSRVPSNPKKKRAEGDFRAGKNDARGQDLPVAQAS